MKKIVCCMVMNAVIFLAACGKAGTSGENIISDEDNPAGVVQKQEQNQVSDKEWVYVPEVFTVGEEYADFEHMQPIGDTFCYVLQGDAEGSGKSICRYSLTDRKLTTISINWPEGGNNWDAGYRFFTRDQGLYMTANVYPADYSSMKRFLCRFDPEGNCLFSRDITEQAGRNVSLCRLTVDKQGRIYIFLDNGEILLYTGEGEYHGSVSYSSPENPVQVRVKGACDGEDGKYYVCISKESPEIPGEAIPSGRTEGANTRCTLLELDFENARLLEIAENLPNINGICSGIRQASDSAGQGSNFAGGNENPAGESDDPDSRYDLLLYNDRAVYGYRFDAQKSDSGSAGEELFIWLDSDINGYCVTNLYLLEDGRLCATVEDWVNDDNAIVALTRTRAEEVSRRENLVIVTVDGESNLTAMAVKFNRGNSRYHLTVKNYESLTDLYNAVLIKEPMDLVDLYGINVQKLASRGFLEDLTPYVDQSEMFERSDFVDGILDAYTFDNTLVGIPAGFMVQTVVGSKTQLESKEGLTLEELFSIADLYSGAKTFDGVTKEEMMEYIIMFNEDMFIDQENGTCHFNSEEFKAVLEFVNRFPDFLKKEKEEPSLPTKIQNGDVLFAIAEMNTLNAFQEYEEMFGEGAACVGFPTADGRGGHLLFASDAYAIAAVSEHKEAAWKFVEEFLAQEKSEFYYVSSYNIFHTIFPTLKKTLYEKAEENIESSSQIPVGKFSSRIYSDGFVIKFHALTWDDVNVILNLVPDATPYFSVKDDEIIKIISEEAQAYYTGQKGIDDVVSIIQNRAQLYVDENR